MDAPPVHKQVYNAAYGSGTGSVYDSYEHALRVTDALVRLCRQYSVTVCWPHLTKFYWDEPTREAVLQTLKSTVAPLVQVMVDDIPARQKSGDLIVRELYCFLRAEFKCLDPYARITIDGVTYVIQEVKENPILVKSGGEYHRKHLYEVSGLSIEVEFTGMP